MGGREGGKEGGRVGEGGRGRDSRVCDKRKEGESEVEWERRRERGRERGRERRGCDTNKGTIVIIHVSFVPECHLVQCHVLTHPTMSCVDTPNFTAVSSF